MFRLPLKLGDIGSLIPIKKEKCMSGLDSIVEEIHVQAKAEAEEILKQADKYCETFIEEAKKDAAIEVEKIKKEAEADRKLYEEKTKSGAEFRQRNSLLKARQECISQVIQKAERKIDALSDAEYFKLLEKIFEANANSGDGIIFLNEKDFGRMPKNFSEKIKSIAKDKGGSVEISRESKNIANGFILAYGEIEENCTMKALFLANIDQLKDIANRTLFGALN